MRSGIRTLALCLALGGACKQQVITAFPDDFVGIGVELTMSGDTPAVVRTIDGGPAQTAGLQANDRVIAIDDVPVAGLGLADVVVRLRGREGSSVDLTCQRDGQRFRALLVRRGLRKTGDDYEAAELRAGR